MSARRRDVAGHKERYGAKHKQRRAWWEPRVALGAVLCWRCELPINPREPWDLGHADDDPTVHMGPEHAACNRGAAARKLNRIKRGERGGFTSRAW